MKNRNQFFQFNIIISLLSAVFLIYRFSTIEEEMKENPIIIFGMVIGAFLISIVLWIIYLALLDTDRRNQGKLSHKLSNSVHVKEEYLVQLKALASLKEAKAISTKEYNQKLMELISKTSLKLNEKEDEEMQLNQIRQLEIAVKSGLFSEDQFKEKLIELDKKKKG